MQHVDKKIVFVGLLPIIIMIVGFIVSAFMTNQSSQDTRTRAATLLTPNIALSTSTEHIVSQEVEVQTRFQVPIYVNPGGIEIIAVDIMAQFDKSKLQLVDIIPNTDTAFDTFLPQDIIGFDTEVIKEQANYTGLLEFSAVAYEQGSTPIPGETQQFLLATLVFDAQSLSSGTTLSFYTENGSTDTNLGSPSSSDDVLADAQQLTIRIVPEIVTPTPTPIPTNTPTPTPTPTSTPTPIPTNTPIPTIASCQAPLTWDGQVCDCPAGNPSNLDGNANCDESINAIDFVLWYNVWVEQEYLFNTDFDRSENVDALDFVIWFNSYVDA